MSIFGKPPQRFEKFNSLHSLPRPPSQSYAAYLYDVDTNMPRRSYGDHYAHNRGIATILRKMGGKWGELFFYNIGMAIFRDVFDIMSDQITFYPPFLPHIY